MEIHSRRGLPWGAFVLAGVAVAAIIAGLYQGNPHFLFLAIAPGVWTFGVAVSRPRPFHGRLHDDGLDVGDPLQTIPFEEIEGLTIGGLGGDPDSSHIKSGLLTVMHRHGRLEIPSRLNVPVERLYAAILAKLPLNGSYQLQSELAEHHRSEVELFGEDRVHSFSVRCIGFRKPMGRGQLCAILLFLCGGFWCFLPVLMDCSARPGEYQPWIAGGILLAVVSGLSWLSLSQSTTPVQRRQLSQLKDSELVISPTGIALVQGHLRGVLKWEELLEVADMRHSIQLKIAGARISIPDIYDRPIALIYRLICRYWKGEQLPASTG